MSFFKISMIISNSIIDTSKQKPGDVKTQMEENNDLRPAKKFYKVVPFDIKQA